MRALLLILDSAGCGNGASAAPPGPPAPPASQRPATRASDFGDEGANTLGHIFAALPELELPALFSLGLWKLLTADVFHPRSQGTVARWGRMRERSAGKDTITGHWELAGAILDEPFTVFRQFPADLVQAIERDAGVHFIGNYPQSGTVILEELGTEHLQTGKLILYTSADSVLQIAAHESIMPAARLYAVCSTARRHANRSRIGRVIARPFTGKPGAFRRTSGRHDYPMVPPRTVLNAIAETGRFVHGIGKVSNIFGRSGVTHSTPTASNQEGMEAIERAWDTHHDGLIFANLVDFDSLYGHRRDVAGYAQALRELDLWLAAFLQRIEPDDLVIITADHGNDPSFPGSDHTREEVPLLVLHEQLAGPLGTRETFADVAATLAEFFELRQRWPTGVSFLRAPGLRVPRQR